MDEPDTPPPPTRPRGSAARLFGVLLRAPLGCAGFLLGMGAVFALAVPPLVGRRAPDLLAGQLDEQFEGRFAVESVGLTWFDRQRITGLTASTPDGERLARVDASAPSLLSMCEMLVDGDAGRYELELTADLVRYADGSWNWQRVLAPRGGGAGGDFDVDVDDDEDGSGPPDGMSGRFVLRVPRLTVSDRVAGGPVEPLEVRDLVADVVLDPERASYLSLEGRTRGPLEGGLSGRVELGQGPLRFDDRPFPFERATLEIERIPVAWVDAFLAAGGLLVAAVGPEASLSLDTAGALEGRELTGLLRLDGPVGRVSLPIRGDGTSVGVLPGAPFIVELREPGAVVASLADTDGQSSAAALEVGEGPWTLKVERLTLPRGVHDGLAGLLGALELAGTFETGPLGLRRTDGAASFLSGLSARFEASPGVQSVATLEAGIAGGGDLTGTLVADPLDALWAALGEDRMPRGALTVDLEALPTATADGLVGTDGLLPAVLGERAGATLVAQPSEAGDGLVVELDGGSDLASVAFRGRLADGALVAEEGGSPFELALDLTAASSPRVVGPLLPVLAEVRTAPGGRRASLRLTDYRLPLDGDPRGLSGDLELDLGEVRATWLPVFEGLSSFDQDRLGPYRIAIREGRAVYDEVELSIDGVKVPLTGSVDLATRAVELAGELPVNALGEEPARLDPTGELRVPLRLGGRWPGGLEVQIDVGELGQGLGEALRGKLDGVLREELDGVLREGRDGAVLDELREQLGDRPELDRVEQAVEGLLGGGLRKLFGGKDG